MEVCAICEKSFTDTDDTAVLREKGSHGINQISALKKDTVKPTAGQKVHTDCRKKYADKRHVLTELDAHTNETRLLRSGNDFDFKHKCLFCGKDAKNSSRKRGHDVFPVRSTDFQSTIKEICAQRNDKWADIVACRLVYVIDLFAADAVYHQSCNVNFRTGRQIPKAFQDIPAKSPIGRPYRETNDRFMAVVEYIEDSEDVVTVTELVQVMEKECGENAYSAKHMKRKLVEYFGDALVISSKEGQVDKFTLRQTASSILHSFEENKRQRTEEEEKTRLIKTVPKLIKSDILDIPADNNVYPSPDSIGSSDKNRCFIPQSLLLLLNLLFSEKDKDVKIASIGQAIIQSCRPRSIQAPLQIGLAVQLYHHFGSRFLIDNLNSMGFCSSYWEVQKFESNSAAMLNTSMPSFFPGSFVQFSADNVDHNVRTLHGSNTFHGMGIIACNTPGTQVHARIPRRDISMDEVVELGRIEIKYFKEPEHEFKADVFHNLAELDATNTHSKDRVFDIFSNIVHPMRPARPNLSGFMHLYEKKQKFFPKSTTTFLSMIGMPPSDLSCITSTLHFVAKVSRTYDVTPVLTFDQPLFQKATYILDTVQPSSPIKNVVLRLGGFHTQMSFLGCIGHLMSGSGLREVLETVYSSNAVVYMLTGKAVARAVRGHFMVDTALHTLLLSSALNIHYISPIQEDETQVSQHTGLGNVFMKHNATLTLKQSEDEMISEESSLSDGIRSITKIDIDNSSKESSFSFCVANSEQDTSLVSVSEKQQSGNEQLMQRIVELYDKMESKQILKDAICEDDSLQSVCEILTLKTDYLKGYRTARLWIQYMEMITILRDFIRAERTSNWYDHLRSVFRMLPFFAASGHNLYLKSAYIYLQKMLQLKASHPEVHEAFVSGFHSVRRTDKFWAGLSTDLIIEQVLMRSLKTTGGLTRGRGISENQRTLWLMSMPAKAEVNNAMLDLLGMNNPNDGHKEIRKSRIDKDAKDTSTIMSFLKERDPFNSSDLSLRNIETGLTAGSKVTADQANDIGNSIIQRMMGKPLNDFSFQRSWQAVTLSEKTSITLSGENINIDTQLLFQRLITAAGRLVDDTQGLFTYELCSVPSSLFDNTGMPRQPTKSLLAKSMWKLGDCSATNIPNSGDCAYVIDGGSLLQRIPWQKGMSFGSICEEYTNYLKQRYRKPVVVFDGYSNSPSTKDLTHLRRQKGAVGTKVLFARATPCKTNKEVFLRNTDNTKNFIALLSETFANHGIPVKQATNDADCLIVKTAVQSAETDTTVVVGEDTDLLVLLCYHVDGIKHGVYFRSDSRPKRGKGKRVWDIQKTKQILGQDVCSLLPFIHALTECDTTSKVHGIGKASALKVLCTKQNFRDNALMFINAEIKDDVKKLGEYAMICLFEGGTSESLDHLRFQKFARKVSCSTSFVEVHSLPPTSSAAAFHSMRVYWQTHTWMGNENLDPLEWGWEVSDNILSPVKMTLPPAPEYLLKVIRCSCKTGCDSKRCTCRKHGLECSVGCGICRGVSCSNSPTLTELTAEDEDSYDEM
ncbi:uncharacterized protein LOC123562441 [Mercenaria mercenaria]|uniref:uncharacterized protein LOC123562441 n=1 Tax=Mercenaria mercenaria TaxID=6596 RepID=UPI00234F927F|nr:uncharacterized protein LOC123562441 [Mercenaria mercenaria]